MARDAELKAHLTAQDDASKVIDQAAKAAEDFEKPRETKLDADVAGALAALDQVAAEAKATAEAAEVLGRALGPELAAKADPAAVVGNLQQMGLSLDQIKGNADELGAKMRELSDLDVGGQLGGSLGTTRGKLDEFNKSADSSKSVLANMVGNATQDLGALGGVAGSAGVAIGQMGEYMSDALSAGDKLGNVIGNFAKIAGPVAGIALFTEVLGKMVEAGKEVGKLNADRATKFFEAISEGSDALKVMREEVEKTGELNFGQAGASMFGIAPGIESVLPLLNKAKIDFNDWAKMIQEFPEKGSGYLAQLKGMNLTGDEAEQVLNALMQATAAKQEADQKAADSSEFLGKQVLSERDAMLAAKEAEGQRTDALDAGARAAQQAADQAAGLTRSTMAAEQAARDLGAQWDALSGQLDAEQAIANIASDFQNMRDRGKEAWDATAAGADDAKEKQEAYAASVLTAKQNVVDLGKQMGLSIPQVKDMLLRIDSGDVDRVEQELRILSRNRTMELSVIAVGGQAFGKYVPGGTNPRSLPPAPAPGGLAVTATGAPGTTGTGGTGAAAPIVVPVVLQLPTPAQVAHRIGPLRVPLFVTANLLADRRINGNL